MFLKKLLGCTIGLAMCAFLADRPALAAEDLPDSYPESYGEIIEASRAEGKLLIYGNIAEYNWRYILEGFRARYPWIKVEIADLGPSTSFERYYSESSVGKHTADLIASGAPDGWHRLFQKGELLPYQSPEAPAAPEWSRPQPGLYTLSTDPMIIVFNKLLMPKDEWPDSLEDLEKLAEEHSGEYRNKLTTYNAASHSFAYDIHWAISKHLGDEAGEFFETVGSVTRPESGGSTMVEKVTSGEYVAGYFVSGITVFPRMDQAGRSKIMGWSLIKDGTPVFHRNIGITTASSSPNSAKLMLDYILSHEGQIAVGKGGLTPYRPDVTQQEVPYYSYSRIADEIGEENIVHVDYDPESYGQYDAFLARWQKAYRLKD